MAHDYDPERLGELLGLLCPAPEGWARAAQELPFARSSLDQIVARAEADAEFRTALIADLEAVLEQNGVDPEPRLVDALRRRLPEA
ncbi:MAG: hypothetical protein H0U46_02525 [Actinobacteria bacterium]|nr:hypothetical protein [Actinomycetota bacterium]